MSVFDKYTGKNFSESADTYNSIFAHFDSNRDGFLDLEEFGVLLEELLNNNDDCQQSLSEADVSSLFSILDLNHDDHLSVEEFRCAWLYWIKQILSPVKALLIIDVQNDFITGSLSLRNCPASQDATAVIPKINTLLEQNLFDVVVYTYDWHPDNHISFIENVGKRAIHPSSKITAEDAKIQDKVVFEVDGTAREQILWPKHCLQNSWGAELHPDLKVVENAYHIYKGVNPDVDSYSAFWDNQKLSQTDLVNILKQHGVTDAYVCGLAYDVCVGFTARHAIKHGFRTVVIEDAARGVTLDGICKTKTKLSTKGIFTAETDQVPRLVKAELRPACLANQAAFNYRQAWSIVQENSSLA
ncbi:nicotinamidase-like [Physella acuta]|uniref:nicotinamidase-like n=1 Tax=Physella acuta TaxID=109671 RepID=UPI0027DD98D0|nr:nicotinamidase-like [Physella acuta]